MSEHDANNELLVGFIDESVHAIQELPGLLNAFKTDSNNVEAVHSVFRTVHSIKGNAGFFSLTAIKKFAHSLENALDEVRNQRTPLTEELCRTLIEGIDSLDQLLHAVENQTHEETLSEADLKLLEQVAVLSKTKGADEDAAGDALIAELLEMADEMSAAGFPESLHWADRIRELGQLSAPAESTKQVSTPAELLPLEFTLGDVELTCSIRKLIELFIQSETESFDDDRSTALMELLSELKSCARNASDSALQATLEDAGRNFKAIYDSGIGVDGMLLSIIWEQLSPALEALKLQAPPEPDTPSPAIAHSAEAPEHDDEDAAQKKGANAKKTRFLRVNEESIDNFLDDVSSLFITCERLKDIQSRMTSSRELRELVEELRQVNISFNLQANRLQKSVVSLRRVPIRGMFSKFPRMARTLANSLDKKLDVQLAGEDLEVDKSLLEELDAPLTHMIRNVADHALELPADRKARGLNEVGNLWLSAEATRTHVLISIRDDGRGIDPDRLRRKAVQSGAISESYAERMSDQEAIELIFHPGLSTAEQVTEISGRGVGMDVVRTMVQENGGEIRVESTLGVGTSFTIEIPIRQAVLVIDGLLIHEGEERFVVPFDAVREVLDLPYEELKTAGGAPVVTLRGTTYAAISLAEMLDIPHESRQKSERLSAVLLTSKQGDACLMIDQVVGKRKVVVNSLQDILPDVRAIGGVAQLGGGELALVLSSSEIIRSLKR
ncbi:chemotaxis protein CheA [Blastopirellula marina]|uniref:histidine kinase n=1 Tax=Blastopirellula marina DSM 3645 TaxID=314230 RepID=A3ZTL9_9BACT|nr:chemotaxis protein CheA [Blastopirellula marina]EAQ80285.1 two-component sensor histidine kinase involved in chemotaxis [Blastopirellula marina DSM 3645]